MLNQTEQTRRVGTKDALLALDPQHHELWTKGPDGYQTEPGSSGLWQPLVLFFAGSPHLEAVCLSTGWQAECRPSFFGLFQRCHHSFLGCGDCSLQLCPSCTPSLPA